MRRVLAVLIALLVALAAAGTRPAAAAPELTVQAGTRIVVDRITPQGGGVLIRGRITEPATGRALPDVTLTVSVGEVSRSVTTDDTGAWRATFPGVQGRAEVSAELAGDATHQPASFPPLPFHVDKAAPRLQLSLPDEVDADAQLDGAVTSTLDDEPLALALTVEVVDDDGTRQIATLTTDDRGRTLLGVSARVLGGAGDRLVVVRFVGNAELNPASAEARVRVMSTTTLVDLRVEADAVAADEAFVIVGRLVDEERVGVPDAPIAVDAGGERAGAAVTGASGNFRVEVPAANFAPGPITLGVSYSSTTPWRRGARATPLAAVVLEARGVPVRYTLLTALVTALAVFGFVFARQAPWRRWLARLAAWRRGQPAPGVTPPSPDAAQAERTPQGGVLLGRPGRMSGLRKAHDDVIAGTVRDAVSHRPVPQALVTVSADGQPTVSALADVRGIFGLPPLPHTTFRVEVTGVGYVRESFTAVLPHRGELREVVVELVPVREAVFAVYRQIALLRLPREALFGVWTPRELLDHVRRARPGAALAALTNAVEEAYFSPRTPEEPVLDQVHALAAAARREQTEA